MDTKAPESPPESHLNTPPKHPADSNTSPNPTTLEQGLEALDEHLAAADKQAAAVQKAVRRLRKAAQDGVLATLPTAIAAARSDLHRLAKALDEVAANTEFDLPERFANGTWLQELAAAAKQAGVVLVQRDGRITAYPVAIRVDPRAQGVRIGRKLERRLRPSVVAAHLRTLQQRPERFNARQFLDRLFALYESRARAEDATWRPTNPGEGPLVALAELHAQLTLLPAAAADYPIEEFTTDLLRLDRQPDAVTTHNHRFELGGSTGRKGGKRLTLFDETGEQHDYYAIRFILEPSHGRADDAPAPPR